MALHGFAATIAAKKNQLLTLGAGWTFDRATNMTIEYLIYPAVIDHFGLFSGGGIMIVGCTILNLILFKVYDWTKKDWLGFEAAKKAASEKENAGRVKRMAIWFMATREMVYLMKFRIVAMLVELVVLFGMSVYSEPLKITLLMRKGAHQYNGFGRRDWTIFIFSTVVSNATWATAVWGGLKAFRWLF